MTDVNPDSTPDDDNDDRLPSPEGQSQQPGRREDDPDADPVTPAREGGAGGGVDDGPDGTGDRPPPTLLPPD